VATVERAVLRLADADAAGMEPQVDGTALDGLKFSGCLPRELALTTLAARLRDEPAIRSALSQPTRVVGGT
jgi:ATP-dependent Lhr-like helicase